MKQPCVCEGQRTGPTGAGAACSRPPPGWAGDATAGFSLRPVRLSILPQPARSLDPRSACSFPGPLSPHPGQRLDIPSQCGARHKRVLWDRGLARTGSGLRGRSGSVLGRRGSRRGDHAPLPGQRLASQWVQASGAAEHPPVHRQPHDEDCPSGRKRPPCTLEDASAGGGGCLAC